MTKIPSERNFVGFNTHSGNGHAWKNNKRNGKRGKESGNPLVYSGSIHDLEKIERMEYERSSGRVRPSGHGPDQ